MPKIVRKKTTKTGRKKTTKTIGGKKITTKSVRKNTRKTIGGKKITTKSVRKNTRKNTRKSTKKFPTVFLIAKKTRKTRKPRKTRQRGGNTLSTNLLKVLDETNQIKNVLLLQEPVEGAKTWIQTHNNKLTTKGEITWNKLPYTVYSANLDEHDITGLIEDVPAIIHLKIPDGQNFEEAIDGNDDFETQQEKLIKSFDRIPAKTESQTTNNLETQQSTNSKKTGPKTGPKSMENLQEVSNQNAKKMFNEFKQLKQDKLINPFPDQVQTGVQQKNQNVVENVLGQTLTKVQQLQQKPSTKVQTGVQQKKPPTNSTPGGKRRKSKKTKKVRKHRGITQTGGSAGKLRKGYKYTGRRLKNGKPEIKKVKQTRK